MHSVRLYQVALVWLNKYGTQNEGRPETESSASIVLNVFAPRRLLIASSLPFTSIVLSISKCIITSADFFAVPINICDL